jgi:hypothetical protein
VDAGDWRSEATGDWVRDATGDRAGDATGDWVRDARTVGTGVLERGAVDRGVSGVAVMSVSDALKGSDGVK